MKTRRRGGIARGGDAMTDERRRTQPPVHRARMTPAPYTGIHPLREYRLRNELTQAKFARLIGWSEGSVHDVESAKIRAGDALVGRVARRLRLTWEEACALCRPPVPIVGALAGPGAGEARRTP